MDSDENIHSSEDSDGDSVDEIISSYNRRNINNGPEGVFDLMSDEDDEDDEDIFDNKYAIQVQKEEMASDIEDDDDDDEVDKNLPDSKAWGTEKSAYYDTDYVDTGKRIRKDEEEEDAEAEEEEAVAIQKRLLSEMQGIKFDLIDNEDEQEEDEEETEKVKMDVTSLSEKEKDDLLARLHPELIPLINDFKSNLKESAEILEPIVLFAERPEGSKLKLSIGYHIVALKHKLVTKYIALLSSYFVLKAEGTDIKKHSITPRLVNIKKLITEVENIISEKGMKKDIKMLAKRVSEGDTVVFTEKEPSEKELDLLKEISIENVLSDEKKDFATDTAGTSESRRNITFAMSKNKGLTAQKKKELRNPRVKHRMKFKKAKVRRKGQVREPRKEVTKYSGELSGIKANVVRSIKFKH